MTRALCRRLFVLVLATTGVLAEVHAAQTVAEYTLRITGELRARNPEAADVFVRANAARDRRELAEAERLYREVLRPRPGSSRRREGTRTSS